MSDLTKPADQFDLIGDSWPVESESAYHAAKVVADDSSTTASTQSESATDAGSKMGDEHGKTADAVSGGYGTAATQLSEQARSFTTISAWMADAAGKVRSAKTDIASLVRAGTQEIRDALNSEVSGTAVSPSSSELIAKYRTDITRIAKTLTTDLDAIGHSLHGDRGASRTPSYTSVSTAPTPEHADPHAVAASYTGDHHAPAPEPHQLPEMPRATTTTNTESPSTTSTPAAPATTHAVNPILSNLISGGQSVSPSGSPTTPSAKSPSTPASAPAGQAHQTNQPTEQQQTSKSPVLPRIPSIPLPNIPAAAESIATAVSSATAHQLPTAPTTPGSAQAPTSTGFTPGMSGTAPVTPTPPVGLSPVGGLPTPSPVVQTPPAPQGGPTAPGVQTPSPASPPPAPRGPAADLGWIQRTYGLAPGVELPKSENPIVPALFVASLPESEAHLHRALASIRHQFEGAGWSQPIAVATIRRGLEARTVYVTSDGLSIHPAGILLPDEVLPIDEMNSAPATSELSGSLMVSEKLVSLIPRTWEVEGVLSSVSGEEGSQSTEQYQALVSAGELLDCKVSRGREGVTDDEALSTFARASIGSTGVGELDVESARIRASRWVGTQPRGYLDTMARYYLSDAAESMSRGNWGEAVYSSEKYLSVQQSEKQAA
ncbi:hypothetical protein I3U71_24575 [Mycobacteroides abscessus subsp. massiliense]|nr:hypothetical protein [Mycobacteroides abscessus subsp. massiliense]